MHGPTLPDWGDYSDILIAGAYERSQDGTLELARTGPFVPPLSLPGGDAIVITDAFKKLLEAANLSGATFRPIIKRRIVRLEWEKWDQQVPEPVEYPLSGEPEDYIVAHPHSPEAATQMGELWEVCLEEHATLEPYVGLADWDGTDWFKAKDSQHIYVSERARVWLEQIAPEWVSFTLALME
jgi:hypothetical protein